MPVEIYGEGDVAAHAPTHEGGGSDPIAGCDLACGQTPSNFTPTSATIGGMVEGIDELLGALGAQSVSVDDDGVLDAASGTEVGATFDLTVNKAAGDYIAESTNVTETNAPGTANKLREWSVGGTPKLSIASSGAITVHGAGTDAAPGLRIDRGSGGAVGITNPGDSQLGLVANGEKLLVDNTGANPTLLPDADGTWDLATAAAKFRQAFISTLVDPLIAASADPVNRAVSFVLSSLTAARTITVPNANVDLTPASQSTVNTGTNATQAVTASTLANRSPRAVKLLNNSGVGAYTISDAAAVAVDGFKLRDDFSISQQDASGDLMAYTVETAEANSLVKVTVWNGQQATFTGSGVTVSPVDFPDGTASLASVDATIGSSDRVVFLYYLTATFVELFGGDPA